MLIIRKVKYLGKFKGTKTKAQRVRDHFEKKILNLLAGMGEVAITKGNENSDLLKDNIIFGQVVDTAVYFIDPDSSDYEIVTDKILENKDAFLMQATKAYFHVKKEQKKFAGFAI